MKRLTQEDREEYAFFFKSMRHSIGYSLTQMADKLNIKSETLRSWERGKSIPSGHISEIVYDVRKLVKDVHKQRRMVS